VAAEPHPGPSPTVRPGEPEIAVTEVQGNVLPGFRTARVALVFAEILDRAAALRFLRRLPVTTCADVLWYRHGRARPGPGAEPPWTNVAFSFPGLSKVAADAGAVTDMAFKSGMAARSSLLADPSDPRSDGYAGNWVIGGPPCDDVDLLLILGADDPVRLGARLAELRRRTPAGLRVRHVQLGSVRPPPHAGREHFGFCDDLSQPVVRGRLSDAADDVLPGRVDEAEERNLVWPGEFLFGYPGQDGLDRRRRGPVVTGGPPWTRDGSLLVVRRLRQDVAAFHAFVRTAARELAARHPALAGLTPEALAARLMGRWASGAPLVRSPDRDRPELAAGNDFAYARDGDALGLVCPRAAHVRRAYPRDAATSALTEANIETHRLLRRSIPYGTATGECGLLFLAYQTSIERQFEFITRAWLNNPHLHDTDDGHDPIAGQSFGTGGARERVFTLPIRTAGGGVQRVSMALERDWVVPTGGGYFFVPSVGALRDLAAGL
jgi:Dyp-type peroxidase family